jgi:hypothetical protein
MQYTGREYLHQFSPVDGGERQSRLLDFRGAAAEYGTPERFLRRLRAEHRLPVVRVGGRIFIERETMEALIVEGREAAPPVAPVSA